MAGDGTLQLIEAVRAVLIEDADLSSAGVFFQRAPREDALPYVLIGIQANTDHKTFAGSAFRHFVVSVKACASEANGRGAIDIAGELQARFMALLSEFENGQTPSQRLNEYLNPLGWRALTPLEVAAIAPYSDNIGDVERWHIGNTFHLRISAL